MGVMCSQLFVGREFGETCETSTSCELTWAFRRHLGERSEPSLVATGTNVSPVEGFQGAGHGFEWQGFAGA